jgi:hypothetical protein
LSSARDALALFAQLDEAVGERGCRGTTGELGQGGIEGHQHLQRGLTVVALVKVLMRPQGELLTGQGFLASPQHGGKTRLRLQDASAAGPAAAEQQLSGVGPEAIGDLLPMAEPDASDQRLPAADRVQVWVGGDQAKGMEGTI